MDKRRPRRSRQVRHGLLALLIAAELAAAQSTPLTPKFTPGRTAYVEETTQIWLGFGEQLPTGETDAAPVYTRLTLGALERVESASSNGVRLRRTIDRVAVELCAPLLSPSGWDTDGVDPPAGTPALGDALAPLLGRSYTIELDVEHRADSVVGLGDIRKSLAPKAGADLALQTVAAALTEAHVRKQWSVLATPSLYPNRRVSVGESWNWIGVERAGATSDLLAAYTCTLSEIASASGRRVAIVDFQAELRPLGGPRPGPIDGQTPFQVSHGSMTGHARFDILSGRYVRLDSESRLTLRGFGPAEEPDASAALNIRVVRSAFACSPGQRNHQKRDRGEPKP